MSERMMATIRQIDDILPIINADAIECAVLGGWKVVVRKGEYKPGDYAVYSEIDSWIPHDLAPFLTPERGPKMYQGVEGNLLKTRTIRGQISQGLLLPLDIHPEVVAAFHRTRGIDDVVDVTEILGIQKWEAPEDGSIGGRTKGGFPTHLAPKTDEERIQNIKRNFERWQELGYTFEVTEKAEGSSFTAISGMHGDHVCSRNLSVWENENNVFWKVEKRYGVLEKLNARGLTYAVQGEVIGPKIQKNIYQLNDYDLLVFKVFDVINQRYLTPEERLALCSEFGFKHVPVIHTNFSIQGMTVDQMLSMADGTTMIGNNPKQLREGLVWKCNQDPSISFKTVSNMYLSSKK